MAEKRKRVVSFAQGVDGRSADDRVIPPRAQRRAPVKQMDRDFAADDEAPPVLEEEEVAEVESDDEGEVERLEAGGDSSSMQHSTITSETTSSRKKVTMKRALGERGSERMAEDFNDAGDAFEPFNLHREREDGHFDASGEFVWKKKSADDYDAWIDSIDTLDPRARSEMQRSAATASRSKGWAVTNEADEPDDGDDDNDAEDDDDEDSAPIDAGARKISSLEVVLELLLPKGETVAAALRRLSGHAGATGAKATGGRARLPSSHAVADLPGRDMASFDRLTEASDYLCGAGGLPDIYSMDARKISWELDDARGSVASHGVTGSGGTVTPLQAIAQPAVSTAQPAASWVYKLSDTDALAVVHGPFSSEQMSSWAGMGFFKVQPVWVARVPLPVATPTAVATAEVLDEGEDIFAGSESSVPIALKPPVLVWQAVRDDMTF